MQQVILKIVMLGLLGILGFIAGRKKYLPEDSGVILSRVVIKLTAPILIFTTMANSTFTGQEIAYGFWIYLLGLAFILLSFAIAHFSGSRLGLQDATRNIYSMHAMFGNVIFLAFPLLDSLSGMFEGKGIVYALFFNLANDTLLWTLGIYLVNKHNTTQWKDNLRHMVNGNTISFGLGLLCILVKTQFDIQNFTVLNHISSFIYDTFHPLGTTTIYLSMLFIGLILSEVKIQTLSDLKARFPIFALSFSKLLLVPMIAFGIMSLLGEAIPFPVKAIVVIQLSMPCATIVPALAAQYESDYKFATECVFISTILGLATLPFMIWILQMFG